MILLLGVLLLVLTGLIIRNRYSHTVDELELQTVMLPYSGFNQKAYFDYINNIRLMVENVKHTELAIKFLNKALDNMKEISFFTDHYQDEIAVQMDYVSKTGREFIMQNSSTNNIYLKQ